MTTAIRTGGVRPLRTHGRITLQINDAGENDFCERYVCSVYGWKRRFATGQGRTMLRAVADWCQATGNDLETVLTDCRLIDGGGNEISL